MASVNLLQFHPDDVLLKLLPSFLLQCPKKAHSHFTIIRTTSGSLKSALIYPHPDGNPFWKILRTALQLTLGTAQKLHFFNQLNNGNVTYWQSSTTTLVYNSSACRPLTCMAYSFPIPSEAPVTTTISASGIWSGNHRLLTSPPIEFEVYCTK